MSRKKAEEILENLSKNEFDQISEEEYTYLLELFEAEGSEELISWLDKKWELSTEYGQRFDLQKIYASIRNKITPAEPAPRVLSVRDLYTYFQKIAVLLFLPMLIGLGYMLWNRSGSEYGGAVVVNRQQIAPTRQPAYRQEYISPAGTRSKITLSDSTTVWLNSSSRLIVDGGYGNSVRRVKLVGQGYFDVRKNPKIPFVVELAKGLSLKVTGTTFTVGAYADSKQIETVLIDGKVEVQYGKERMDIKPSQRVLINRSTERINVATVSDESFRSWKDGILIFNETPMQEVVTTLERWFNVSIKCEGTDIVGYRFTAKFDNCSLEQVLTYISYSSPIAYSIKERNVVLVQKK